MRWDSRTLLKAGWRRVSAPLTVALIVTSGFGCSDTNTRIAHDPRPTLAVLATLRAGTTDEQAAALVQRFLDQPGVVETGWRGTDPLFLRFDDDASAADVAAAASRLRKQNVVSSVTVETHFVPAPD